MSSPFGPPLVVVEPSLAASADEATRLLEAAGLEPRVERLQRVADARDLIRAAATSGTRYVVAVGGDDVVHEVVNGLFDTQDRTDPPVLGVVPAGMDNEFFRQFGLPMDLERAVGRLAGENVYPIDVAAAHAVGPDRRETSRILANIAQIGLGGDMAARAGRTLGGADRRKLFLAFWRAILRSKRAEVHVQAARQTYDGPAFEVVIGNGRFGPGAFRVSPRSFPGDGVLEVLIHHGPKSSAFTSLPKQYRGEQVPSPHISELRGNRVRVRTDPPLAVAVDGRVIGTTPASFDVKPQALWLKV